MVAAIKKVSLAVKKLFCPLLENNPIGNWKHIQHANPIYL